MSFYVSCRDQSKGVRQRSRDARERHDRKKEYFDDKRGDPLQGLRIQGHAARTQVDASLHRANESGENLVPWNATHTDNLMDRFDVRSMLDVLADYDGRNDRPDEEEEQQREVLLNYERYRSLVESHRLGLDEDSWLRRVERDVAVRRAAMEALEGKMETACSVDDLRTPEERAQERALVLHGQLGSNSSGGGSGGPPPGLMGTRPNAKAGNASIGFNYGTAVVSEAQLAAEREADLDRLRRVYEDAAAAEDGEDDDEGEGEGDEHGSSDGDSDGDSGDSDDDDGSVADPSDSLDTSSLPVVLSIDAVEMLARGYGVLTYDSLHEHNAAVEARKQVKRAQRAQAHALRRVTGGRAGKGGKKLNKRARRRIRERLMEEMARQTLAKARARRQEEQALGGGGAAAGSASRHGSSSHRHGGRDRDRHERKRKRSRSRSGSASESVATELNSPARQLSLRGSSDVEEGGRRFITSFPMPSASVRAPMGLGTSTRNSAFDADRGSVDDHSTMQGAPGSGFFLLPPPRSMVESFFSDLAPVNARDETMRRLDGDIERREEYAAQRALQGGSSLAIEKKHWAPRQKRTSRSPSPDSPRHARAVSHAAGSRSGASASGAAVSASAKPAVPAPAAKLTGAALLKSKMKSQLSHLVHKEDEVNRRKRREEALQQREMEEQLEQQRRDMQREREREHDLERRPLHSHPPGMRPPPGLEPPPGLAPPSSSPSPSHRRSRSRSRSPPHRSRSNAHSHSDSHSRSSRRSRSRSRSRSPPSHGGHRDRRRSRSRSRDSHRHSRRRSRSRSPSRSRTSQGAPVAPSSSAVVPSSARHSSHGERRSSHDHRSRSRNRSPPHSRHHPSSSGSSHDRR